MNFFKTYLFLLSVLICHTNIFAQDSSRVSYLPKYSNQLKLAPFRIIDPINGGLEFSYERNYGNHWATEIGAVFMMPVLPNQKADLSGYKISLLEKYFFKNLNHRKTIWHFYAAPEVAYASSSYTNTGYFRDSDYSDNYLDTFYVHKKILCFNLRAGLQIEYGHFIYEMNAGVGYRNRTLIRSGLSTPSPEQEFPGGLSFDTYRDKTGSYHTISIPVGIKVGFCF